MPTAPSPSLHDAALTADAPQVEPAELLRLLEAKEYARLETALAKAQQAYESGDQDEEWLHTLFGAFAVPKSKLGEYFQEWIEQYPQSYAAHVALATWFLERAYTERGGATSNHVSDRGFRALAYFTEQAQGCATHATELTDVPVHAWLIVGKSESVKGNKVDPRDLKNQHYPQWLRRGLEARPSYLLCQQMLAMMRTEWGGSETMMLDFVRQQQDAGQLSAGQMQRLWARFHASVAHYEIHFANNYPKALERAQAATELDERYLMKLLEAQHYAQAPIPERVQTLERLLQQAQPLHITPDLILLEPLYGLANNLPPYAKALGDWLGRWAHKGDENAALLLGYFHLYLPQLGLPKPMPWLKQLRAQGHVDAATMLVQLCERRSSEQVFEANLSGSANTELRSDIFQAAQLGDGEQCWRVVQHFKDFAAQFDLDERDRLQMLLQAADQGENQARVLLANMLIDGLAELGGDGVLRQMAGQPTQGSLDYAKYLLQRAAAAGDEEAQKQLKRTPERDWDAAQRRQGIKGRVAAVQKAHNPQSYASTQVERRIKATKPTLQDRYRQWYSNLTWWEILGVLWLIGIFMRGLAALTGNGD